MADRYEIDHSGRIVVGESSLCSDIDQTISTLFSQYGWNCNQIDKVGSCRTVELKDSNDNIKHYNIYCGTIRNEARNPYEKKIQLGTASDPRTKSKDNTIILGVYVYKETDSIKDAIFVGYPIDDSIRYDTNPSIRGTFINKILIQAKNDGFVYDDEHNSVAFRSEFAFYYLSNYYDIHYNHKTNRYMSDVEYEATDIPSDVEPSAECADNIILYGVPGCGKSRFIRDNYLKSATIDQQERIVFHPDYSYSDFVGQILPTTTIDAKGEKRISYPFVPGPFTRILKSAQDNTKNYYLIIEEINRGNAPAIFGDIFQLLDRKSAEDVVVLGGSVGESSYTINNKDIALEVYGDETHPVSIPSNLFILATMNTADQNVFTLDTAFKRRWRMRSIMNNLSKCFFAGEEICGTGISWGSFVDKINSIIISNSKNNIGNEDKRIGAFFVQKPDLVDEDIFSEKVLMYLWNDAFKYNREDIFNPEYESLEQLIESFKKIKFDIFKIEFEKMTTPVGSGSIKPATDYYSKVNKPVAQALFEKLITKLEAAISPLYADCASGLFYIRIRTDGTKKISLADVSFKDDALAIQTEKPTTSTLAIGTDYTGGTNRNHRYDIECKDTNLDQVADIIREAYSTLKKV